MNQFWMKVLYKIMPNRLPIGLALQNLILEKCIRCNRLTHFKKDCTLLACAICCEHLKIFECYNCARLFHIDLSIPQKKYNTMWCKYCIDDVPQEVIQDYSNEITEKDFAKYQNISTFNKMREYFINGSPDFKKSYAEFIDRNIGQTITDKMADDFMATFPFSGQDNEKMKKDNQNNSGKK